MDARIVWLAIAGAVAAIFLHAAAGAGRRPRSVLLVGDSLAVGLRTPLRAAMSRRGWDWHDATQGATTAGYWRSRLPELLRVHRPGLVLISVGTNDCRVEDSAACTAFRDLTENLAAQCDGAGARPLFLLPDWVPWSSRIAERLAEGPDAISPTVAVALQSDHVHPTVAGYQAWSADLARRINQ